MRKAHENSAPPRSRRGDEKEAALSGLAEAFRREVSDLCSQPCGQAYSPLRSQLRVMNLLFECVAAQMNRALIWDLFFPELAVGYISRAFWLWFALFWGGEKQLTPIFEFQNSESTNALRYRRAVDDPLTVFQCSEVFC